MQGNGEAFRLAIAQLDEQITKAILYQTLATGEGQHQARAASETHQDILDVLIRYAKLAIARCLETDFVYDLVKFNFGEDAARNLAPQVVLPNSEIQDFPGRAAAVATLHSTEFFADDQMASLDAMLGLKQRNMKNWLALKDEQRQLEKDKAMKPMGGPGGAKRPLGGVASGITDPDSRGPSAGKIGDKT
jgi:phage gp29-like protein